MSLKDKQSLFDRNQLGNLGGNVGTNPPGDGNFFTDKGLNEYDAITNARLAKILTIDDYDTTKQEVILWTPEPDYEVNL